MLTNLVVLLFVSDGVYAGNGFCHQCGIGGRNNSFSQCAARKSGIFRRTQILPFALKKPKGFSTL
jgi:hypothetical protein